jgi:hypothetical protein
MGLVVDYVLVVRLAESARLALGAIVVRALAGLEMVDALGTADKLAVLGYSHSFGEAFCGDSLAHIFEAIATYPTLSFRTWQLS